VAREDSEEEEEEDSARERSRADQSHPHEEGGSEAGGRGGFNLLVRIHSIISNFRKDGRVRGGCVQDGGGADLRGGRLRGDDRVLAGHAQRGAPPLHQRRPEREFFIDNLLVRIHFVIVMIR